MIRTRDFLLFILIVGFLVLAISYTLLRDRVGTPAGRVALSESTGDVVYDVTIAEPETIDRQARIMALRQQIADLNSSTISTAPPVPNEESQMDEVASSSEGQADEVTETATSSTMVQLCSNYTPSTLWWPESGIGTAERDGMRVVYVETVNATDPTADPIEDVLVQLPMRSLPIGGVSCLQSDVVGVALDGSLIRNQDYTAYRIMEKYTLIGYALDGFPIYGSAPDVQTDECGGTVVGVSYRYYLSPDREGMIGCFAGVPVHL